MEKFMAILYAAIVLMVVLGILLFIVTQLVMALVNGSIDSALAIVIIAIPLIICSYGLIKYNDTDSIRR